MPDPISQGGTGQPTHGEGGLSEPQDIAAQVAAEVAAQVAANAAAVAAETTARIAAAHEQAALQIVAAETSHNTKRLDGLNGSIIRIEELFHVVRGEFVAQHRSDRRAALAAVTAIIAAVIATGGGPLLP